MSVTHPKVTTAQLPARYPAYIVIDRTHFQLRLYRHLKLARSFPIAVGMQGLETPAGLYDVQWKQVNPPWLVPNSAWAGSLAGRTIPPGPQDPLKARFLAFNGGAGIHGIDPSEYGNDRPQRLARLRPDDDSGRDRPLPTGPGPQPSLHRVGKARLKAPLVPARARRPEEGARGPALRSAR